MRGAEIETVLAVKTDVGTVMARNISCCKNFSTDDSGATSIEYALIAGIISIAIVLALTNLRTELTSTFTKVGTELKNNAAN